MDSPSKNVPDAKLNIKFPPKSVPEKTTLDVSAGVPNKIHFYSADEVPETPAAEGGKRAGRAGPTPKGKALPSKEKPTVASLAKSLEQLAQALPGITSRVQDLSQRIAAIGVNSNRQTISLRATLVHISYGWINYRRRAEGLAPRDAPPRHMTTSAQPPGRMTFYSSANRLL